MVAPFGVEAIGGVLNTVVASTIALANAGVDVELWQPHHWPPSFREHVQLLDAAGVPRVVLDEQWPPRALLGLGALRRARDRRVRVAHLHSVFTPSLNQLGLALHVPYVLTPHGGYSPASFERGHLRKRAYWYAADRITVRRAAAVIALTPAEAHDLKNRSVRSVRVVPNGVSQWDEPVDRRRFRDELGLGADDRLAIFVGRLDVLHKGLDRLIPALAEAPDWHVALVGPDVRGGAAALHTLARRLGVEQRLRIVGARSGAELRDAVAAADLFALPSRWEGLSVALLDALALGVPAAVTPAVEKTIGVAAAGAGWVVSADHFAGAFRAAGESAEERTRRGLRAARLAEGYSWSRVAAGLAAVYDEVTSAPRERVPHPPDSTPAALPSSGAS
jgi:glycosyltransferase involved in cell wall biosynthesis